MKFCVLSVSGVEVWPNDGSYSRGGFPSSTLTPNCIPIPADDPSRTRSPVCRQPTSETSNALSPSRLPSPKQPPSPAATVCLVCPWLEGAPPSRPGPSPCPRRAPRSPPLPRAHLKRPRTLPARLSPHPPLESTACQACAQPVVVCPSVVWPILFKKNERLPSLRPTQSASSQIVQSTSDLLSGSCAL